MVKMGLDTYRLLLYLVILSMVAVAVMGGDPSTPSDSGNGATAMAKSFATSTKLSETNYAIWYAGILTILVGMTVEPYAKMLKILEALQVQLHNTMEVIENGLGRLFYSNAADFKTKEPWITMEKNINFSIVIHGSLVLKSAALE